MVRGGGTVARTRRRQWWGRVVTKHEEGRGVWVKNPKPSHEKRRRRMVHGRGTVARTRRRRWRRGCGVAKHEGRGVWVKNPKPSRRGSVPGALCGTGVGDGAWGWHGGTYEAAAVAGSCGRETRGGEGGLGEKPKTEPSWLSFGLQRGCRRWRGVLWGYRHPLPC
jgi:hypothetical protein